MTLSRLESVLEEESYRILQAPFRELVTDLARLVRAGESPERIGRFVQPIPCARGTLTGNLVYYACRYVRRRQRASA